MAEHAPRRQLRVEDARSEQRRVERWQRFQHVLVPSLRVVEQKPLGVGELLREAPVAHVCTWASERTGRALLPATQAHRGSRLRRTLASLIRARGHGASQDAAGAMLRLARQRLLRSPALLFLCSSNKATTPGRSLNALPKSALRKDITAWPAARKAACIRRAVPQT